MPRFALQRGVLIQSVEVKMSSLVLSLLMIGCKDADELKDTDSGASALEVPTFEPYASATASSLPAELTSCAVIAEDRCVDGATQVCSLYDTSAGDWATDVAPMTEQAFYFERYYDLFQ